MSNNPTIFIDEDHIRLEKEAKKRRENDVGKLLAVVSVAYVDTDQNPQYSDVYNFTLKTYNLMEECKAFWGEVAMNDIGRIADKVWSSL